MDQDQRPGGRRDFHLEINSMADFEKLIALLVSLIRDVPANDEAEIAAIAGKVKAEREKLNEDLKRNTPVP